MAEKKEIKSWQLALFAIIIIVSLAGRAYSYYWPKAQVKIGSQDLKVLVAANERHRLKGWSGSDDMGKYGGMLFTYPAKEQHAMVMRDMNFALDIVWLDGNIIVDMAPSVQPEKAEAAANLTVYMARLPSTAVIELPAGFLLKNGVKIGDKVEILR